MFSKAISILKTSNSMCIFKFKTCFFPRGPGKRTDEGKPMKTYSGVNGDCLRGKIMTVGRSVWETEPQWGLP